MNAFRISKKDFRSGSTIFSARTLGFAAVLCVTMLQIGGCGTVLSRTTMDQVDPYISPQAVLNNPKPFVGQTILVGGTILSAKNLQEGTLIEVLTYPTDRRANRNSTNRPWASFCSIRYLDSSIKKDVS